MPPNTVITQNACARVVARYCVFVHGETGPSDAEWAQLVGLYGEVKPMSELRVLIYTEGGAPNAGQRAKLKQALGGSRPLTAVVTASALARAAGTAISWFNPNFRFFSPDDVASALAYLDANEIERVKLQTALRELRDLVPKRRS